MNGRPVLGGISGLLLGLFLAIDLQQFGVWPLDEVTTYGLPLLGVALGLAVARWAPFGDGEEQSSDSGPP